MKIKVYIKDGRIVPRDWLHYQSDDFKKTVSFRVFQNSYEAKMFIREVARINAEKKKQALKEGRIFKVGVRL